MNLFLCWWFSKMDWCEWFGFAFDPFFDKPLESDKEINDLMIVQERIDQQIQPMIRQIKKVPFLSLISGERGIGKSTLLYYSMFLSRKEKNLSVYVAVDQVQLEFSKKPTYDITRSLMYAFGANLLDSIAKYEEKFLKENMDLLSSLARYLGLKFYESEGFIPSGQPYRLDFFELKRYILAILNRLSNAGIRILLTIDNLDKITKLNILVSFFTAPVAQSLFDELRGGGVSILISVGPQFLSAQKRKKTLSYLSQNIRITALSPTELLELVEKRIKYINDPPPTNPFKKEALIAIAIHKKGITREILKELRIICIKAFEERISTIPESYIKEGFTKLNEPRIIYDLLEKSEALKNAALKLCSLANIPDLKIEKAISDLMAINDGKNLKTNTELLKTLLDLGIIRSTVSGTYVWTNSIQDLFDNIQKNDWKFIDFLNWILVKNSMKVLITGVPGINASQAITKFGPIPAPNKTTVGITINNILQTFPTHTLIQEAMSHLDRATVVINRVGSMTWDNIDNTTVYKDIYWALVDFLQAFSKLYICCGTRLKIRLKSEKYADYIENSIHHFQKEYDISFKSLYCFLRYRANIKGLGIGGFAPSHSDVKTAFNDFELIVNEFTMAWQSISNNFSTLEIPDLQHNEVLNLLKEYSLLMGYPIDHDDLTRFQIDGKKYYNLGFSKFPLNEATIDLVRERSVFNRYDQSRSCFFLALVNPDSKCRAGEKQILAFLQKSKDLVAHINSSLEQSKSPKGYPQYLLIYVSANGFEMGVNAIINASELPPQSQILTVTRYQLENMIRMLRLPKRLPSKRLETDFSFLWEKDLEQLLRISLQISKTIRKKFEKKRTILLADMKDFTKRTGKDQFESAQAVQKMSDILNNTVEKYGGSGINTEGDSFIAHFEKPEKALIAALKAIKEINDYNIELDENKKIYIRVGISSGEILFKNNRPFIGMAVNIAARIMKEAEPNKIIVSEETYKMISAFRTFNFIDKGKKLFKGLEKPIQIYQAEIKE